MKIYGLNIIICIMGLLGRTPCATGQPRGIDVTLSPGSASGNTWTCTSGNCSDPNAHNFSILIDCRYTGGSTTCNIAAEADDVIDNIIISGDTAGQEVRLIIKSGAGGGVGAIGSIYSSHDGPVVLSEVRVSVAPYVPELLRRPAA